MGGWENLQRSLSVPPTEMRYLGFTTPNHTEIHAGRSLTLALGKGTLCQDSSARPTDNPFLTTAAPAEAHATRVPPASPGGLQKY